jgi:hypothetical protein
MIERSYGRWMPKGVDRGVRSRAPAVERGDVRRDKPDPFTGPQLKKAVGDGLSHGTGKGSKEWSHGESNIGSEETAESREGPENALESRRSETPDNEQPAGKKRQE